MHIKNFLFLVLFIAGFVLPLHTAYAQDGAANSTPAEISRSISKGDIQGLIDTLEDPQEREKFIKNLNTRLHKLNPHLEGQETANKT